MGFDVGRTRYKLSFADPALADFQVEVAALSVRETFAYNDAIAEAPDAKAVMRIMVETVGHQLVSWNAEKDGQPLPATLEGLLDLDDYYVSPIITGWLQASKPAQDEQGEPDPTVQDRPSIEASLPMSPLAEPDENGLAPAG